MKTTLVSCALLAVLLTSTSAADESLWTGTQNALWSEAGNWDPRPPQAGDLAIFRDGANQSVVINSSATVGSIDVSGLNTWTPGYVFQGNGRIILEGTDSRIGGGDGPGTEHRFNVPIDLRNDALLASETPDYRPGRISFARDVNIGAHTLSTRGQIALADISVNGTGLVEIASGNLGGTATIASNVKSTGGFLGQSFSTGDFTILGNADIDAQILLRDELDFGTIDGGGSGTLNIDVLQIERIGGMENLTEVEFNILPGWDSITISEVRLPNVGAAEWDTSRLTEGILRLFYENVSACDFNVNGFCEVHELDLVLDEIRAETNDARYDFNDDGVVDTQDRDIWLLEAATSIGYTSAFLPGDTNLDGSVDAQDLMMIGLNWQGHVESWGQGDFNLDLVVDAADLNALGLNWQSQLSRVDAVPEPTAYLLVVLGIAVLVAILRIPATKALVVSLLCVVFFKP